MKKLYQNGSTLEAQYRNEIRYLENYFPDEEEKIEMYHRLLAEVVAKRELSVATH